ncbi:hypothetical protein TOC8172_31720 [Pseudomonas syringae]
MLGLFNLTLCKLERCLYGSLLRSLFFRLGSRARFFFGLALCGFLGLTVCGLLSKTLNVLPVLFFNSSVQRFKLGLEFV